MIPNFAYRPTITSRQSGDWSSPATWNLGRVPSNNDVVMVSIGHEVSYDVVSDNPIAAVGVEGTLRFRRDINTRLKVGTLIVSPNGKLEIGTPLNPILPNFKAEIIIANRPLYTTSADSNTGVSDPEQFGTGLIVLGEISIYGEDKSPTWTRLVKEPIAGDTVLMLKDRISGWHAGDRIVLPDTRNLPVDTTQNFFKSYGFSSQTESMTISSISADGRQITLSEPLKFTHLGATDPDGTPTKSFNGDLLLPHIGNLARNIIIRSENPSGTRGHTMYTHFAKVSIHNAGFYDLGRTTINNLDSTTMDSGGNPTHIGTNQIARYPAHFHHLFGMPRLMPATLTDDQKRSWLETNGWQYEFVGNAVASGDNSPHLYKWGIVVHASHFGKISENVVYGVAGSGIQTEDASESYNIISKNFALKINGEGKVRLAHPSDPPDIAFDIGRDGSGFWFRGPQNWVEGNVASDATFSTFYYNSYYLKDLSIPLFPGANPAKAGEGANTRLRRLLKFSDNEGYGAAQIGLYGAWVLGCCNAGDWPEMKINNFIAWHAYQQTIEWYHNGRTTFDHLILRADPRVTSHPAFNGKDMLTLGFDLTAYENVDLAIKNADVRGMIIGIDMPRKNYEFDPPAGGAPTLIDNSEFQNYINVRVSPEHSDSRPREMILANSKLETFSRPATSINPSPLNIEMTEVTNDKDPVRLPGENLEVQNYNLVQGDNFRVYYPDRSGNPCANTRAGISGYVCTSGIVTLLPPARNNGLPGGQLAAGTTSTAISLTTNAPATCKYSTSDQSYSLMPNTFSTTGATSHSSTVSGLSNGNSYAYHVKCRSNAGIENTDDFVISFSIANNVLFDYTLSSSGAKTITRGQSTTNTITAALSSGTTQQVSFSASGFPSGVTSSFSPNSCNPTCISTLTINSLNSTPAGTYTIFVNGISGILTKSTSFTLIVNQISSNSCPWDLTGQSGQPDSNVGLLDVLFVVKDYGRGISDPGYNPKEDFDIIPGIGLGDVLTVVNHFGACPA